MNDKVLAVLLEIQSRVPKEWKDRVTRPVDAYGEVKRVLAAAIADPETSEDRRFAYNAMLNSSLLDKKEYAVDEEAEKLIDEFLEVEITKAIKEKRIPKPKKSDITKWKSKLKPR